MIDDRLLRLSEVKSIVGLRRTKVYELIQKGDFPPPVKLSPRASRWRASEVQRWLRDLPQQKETPARQAGASAAMEPKVYTWQSPRDPIGIVLSRLHGVRPTGDGRWVAKCPAHDDRKPSLSIARGRNGDALLRCFAGCDTADVVTALGLRWSDLFVRGRR